MKAYEFNKILKNSDPQVVVNDFFIAIQNRYHEFRYLIYMVEIPEKPVDKRNKKLLPVIHIDVPRGKYHGLRLSFGNLDGSQNGPLSGPMRPRVKAWEMVNLCHFKATHILHYMEFIEDYMNGIAP